MEMRSAPLDPSWKIEEDSCFIRRRLMPVGGVIGPERLRAQNKQGQRNHAWTNPHVTRGIAARTAVQHVTPIKSAKSLISMLGKWFYGEWNPHGTLTWGQNRPNGRKSQIKARVSFCIEWRMPKCEDFLRTEFSELLTKNCNNFWLRAQDPSLLLRRKSSHSLEITVIPDYIPKGREAT